MDSFLRYGYVDFVCEIVKESRRLVGAEYPLCIRFSQWRVAGYDDKQFNSPKEMESVLLPLKDAGRCRTQDEFHFEEVVMTRITKEQQKKLEALHSRFLNAI